MLETTGAWGWAELSVATGASRNSEVLSWGQTNW